MEQAEAGGPPSLRATKCAIVAATAAMASIAGMTTLANDISEKTKIVTDYLTSEGLDEASFDAGGLAELPIPPENESRFKARLELAAAMKELCMKARGGAAGYGLELGVDAYPWAVLDVATVVDGGVAPRPRVIFIIFSQSVTVPFPPYCFTAQTEVAAAV